MSNAELCDVLTITWNPREVADRTFLALFDLVRESLIHRQSTKTQLAVGGVALSRMLPYAPPRSAQHVVAKPLGLSLEHAARCETIVGRRPACNDRSVMTPSRSRLRRSNVVGSQRPGLVHGHPIRGAPGEGLLLRDRLAPPIFKIGLEASGARRLRLTSEAWQLLDW